VELFGKGKGKGKGKQQGSNQKKSKTKVKDNRDSTGGPAPLSPVLARC
jgi:hypothetical protein